MLRAGYPLSPTSIPGKGKRFSSL